MYVTCISEYGVACDHQAGNHHRCREQHDPVGVATMAGDVIQVATRKRPRDLRHRIAIHAVSGDGDDLGESCSERIQAECLRCDQDGEDQYIGASHELLAQRSDEHGPADLQPPPAIVV